jgi:hypothetical protein
MAYAIITDLKKMNTGITNAIKTAGKLQDAIHVLACSALAHAQQHGDFGAYARLVYGLPAGQRVKTLKEWAMKYAPVKYHDKESKVTLDKSEKAKPWDIAGALANPYFNVNEVTQQKPLTLQEVIEYLAKKAKSKDEDTADIAETRRAIGEIEKFARKMAGAVELATAGTAEPEGVSHGTFPASNPLATQVRPIDHSTPDMEGDRAERRIILVA